MCVVIQSYTAGTEITQDFFFARFLSDFAARSVYCPINPMNPPPNSLSAVLHRWRVAPPADPNFRAAVWHRVDARARDTWPAYVRSHAAAWSLAAVVMLGVAAYSGTALAQARVKSDRETMVVNYLVDLDPRVQAVLKP